MLYIGIEHHRHTTKPPETANKETRMKVSKIRKAQIIVAALNDMQSYPSRDDTRVKSYARLPMPRLDDLHARAVSAILSRHTSDA